MRFVLFLVFTIWISGVSRLSAQAELNQNELSDYTSRAKKQIEVFLTNVPIIAEGYEDISVRKAGIRQTLKIFAKSAFIQEQNKFTTKKKSWKPDDYLNALLERSGRAPIIISFDIIDDLTPDKMKKKTNKDGSISYSGKMKFRQYYCRMKEGVPLKEPTKEEPNINCAYSDTTDKAVRFELSVRESITGRYWVTKVCSIETLNVF